MIGDDILLNKLSVLAVNTSTTQSTPSIDGAMYSHALFLVIATTGGSQTISFLVQDSDDNSSFANVSGIATLTIPADKTLTNRTLLIDHSKVRRYVRLRIVHTGGATMSSAAVLQQNNKQSAGVAPDVIF